MQNLEDYLKNAHPHQLKVDLERMGMKLKMNGDIFLHASSLKSSFKHRISISFGIEEDISHDLICIKNKDSFEEAFVKLKEKMSDLVCFMDGYIEFFLNERNQISFRKVPEVPAY